MPTVIAHGPMACGKSRNSDALAARFGCDVVVEDWSPGDQIEPGALHLTCQRPRTTPPHVKVVDFTTLGLSPATGIDQAQRTVRVVPSLRGKFSPRLHSDRAPYRSQEG